MSPCPPVTISDTVDAACDDTVANLDAGEPYSYTCAIANVTGDFTNTVVVTGTPPLGAVVTDTGTAAVVLVSPAIQIAKTPDSQTIQSGDAVTFTISVTNTGDITLTTIAIVDAAAPDCDDTVASLGRR